MNFELYPKEIGSRIQRFTPRDSSPDINCQLYKVLYSGKAYLKFSHDLKLVLNLEGGPRKEVKKKLDLGNIYTYYLLSQDRKTTSKLAYLMSRKKGVSRSYQTPFTA